MHEAACCCHCLRGFGTRRFFVFAVVALALLPPSARAGVNFGGAHLTAPGERGEGAVGEGAEARVDYFAFRVPLVIVVALAEDSRDLVVAAEVDNGKLVCFGDIPRAEEWGEFRRHRGWIGTAERAWWIEVSWIWW
jgi:hypothetical protein